MQKLAALALLLSLGGIFPAKAQAVQTAKAAKTAQPKAASFGLCADQMLMMLADPHQITSLSAQATGPLSAYPKTAAAYPANRGSAEEVIASGAKLLLQSDAVSQQSAAALGSFGVKIVRIPFANSWAEVDAMVRLIARELGQVQRGEAVIRNMHQRLAAVRATEPSSHWPSIIYYRPDGGGAGTGTFVDISLKAAGFRNVQAEWGPPLWSGIPAERVVRQPPDAFVVSYFDTNNHGSSVLRRNPMLWGQARSRPVITMAGKYWNCGTPLLVDAVELLAKERQKLMRSPAMRARRAAADRPAR